MLESIQIDRSRRWYKVAYPIPLVVFHRLPLALPRGQQNRCCLRSPGRKYGRRRSNSPTIALAPFRTGINPMGLHSPATWRLHVSPTQLLRCAQ